MLIKVNIRGSKNAVQTAGSVEPSLMFGSADNGASVSGSRGEIRNKCVDIQRKDKVSFLLPIRFYCIVVHFYI